MSYFTGNFLKTFAKGMTLKEAIVQWILQDEPDYRQGVALYGQLDYNPHLFRQFSMIESGGNSELLLQELGKALREDKIPGSVAIEHVTLDERIRSSIPVTHEEPDSGLIDTEFDEAPENVDFDLRARLNLDVDSLIRTRNHLHKELHNATSDLQRKDIIAKQQQNQDAIEYKKALIRRLESGEKLRQEEIETKKPEAEDIFAVPDDVLQHRTKIDNLKVRRSKRKSVLKSQKEGSEKYEKALKEWDILDKAIKHLVNSIKDRA